MNNKNAYRTSKTYKKILVFALVWLMLALVLYIIHVHQNMLLFQQNVIGVLYQKDEACAQEYVYSLFETVEDVHITKGKQALEQLGFTEAGIHFIGKNIGFEETSWIGIVLLLGAFGFLFLLVYIMTRQQEKERQALEQEILFLKKNQMEEDYQEKQNQRIQSFIENIAHQMKTPLSRVFSSLDIVEDEINDEQKKMYIEECYVHLESMNILIKKLMDIGKLEAGKVIFRKEKISLRELFSELQDSYTRDASRIKIDIKKELDFYGDDKWLKEAFSNIICNALEADLTERPVEITGTYDENYVKISIRDYGKGLSEKDIPNIFDRFYLPEGVKENHTGIGLNLARLIIEGHNGIVYVYNHSEGGAVFQVLLPVYESLKVR